MGIDTFLMNTDHVGRTVDGSPVQSGLAQRDRLSFRPTEPPRNRPRRNMTPSLASRLTIWSRHDLMFTGPSWSCSQGIFEGPCDVYIYGTQPLRLVGYRRNCAVLQPPSAHVEKGCPTDPSFRQKPRVDRCLHGSFGHAVAPQFVRPFPKPSSHS